MERNGREEAGEGKGAFPLFTEAACENTPQWKDDTGPGSGAAGCFWLRLHSKLETCFPSRLVLGASRTGKGRGGADGSDPVWGKVDY